MVATPQSDTPYQHYDAFAIFESDKRWSPSKSMHQSPIPLHERERLENLNTFAILDTPPEEEYEEIVRLASLICETPISTVTLIDEHRQWFKAKRGLDKQEDTRDVSFCAHAVYHNDFLIVPDATQDERFVNNPLVTGNPNIRFYAGMPLRSPEGYALGTLCVIDRVPRTLTPFQQESLQILSSQLMRYMELRRSHVSLTKAHDASTRLLSVIGHDIRGPLQSLRALISLVEDFGLSPADFKSMLPDLKDRVNDVTKLLSNILQWSTSQFDSSVLQKSQINLWKIVEENSVLNHSQFHAKENVVRNELNPHLLALADEHMISFIIRNLLLNANKFSNASEIRVYGEVNGSMVKVCINDAGVGIPADRLATLFSWEHRRSTQGTRGEKGSGYALLIAREFAQKNGGDMWVESTLGEGTRFYVTMPAVT